MLVIMLAGFAIVLYELNTLASTVNRGIILESKNGKQKRSRSSSRPITFSDEEASSNSEKANRLRDYYHSHCICERRDCRLFIDQRWTLPEAVQATSLDAAQSNETTRVESAEGTQNRPKDPILDDNEDFWENDSLVAKCPFVILDLGSNRGDTLQAYLNAMLSSIYSPSPLSPFHSSHGCNHTQQWTKAAPSYHFSLQPPSIRPRAKEELSKRQHRVHERHQLDMEAYLDLHLGRLSQEGDPWMDYQMKKRMEQQQNVKGDARMKEIFEEQHMKMNDYVEQERPRPEQYCFYGVEGNPAFTRKLRALEAILMGVQSSSENGGHDTELLSFEGLRLLRHLHFFTSTVVSAENAPTELYLDSISTDHVGSSTLDTHKYALMGGEKVVVQGKTLDSLLESILDGFGSGSNESKHSDGGHLILKIDIEGSEYPVLKQAMESGLLCNYARGNRVDLVVEFHKWVIEDKKQKQGFAKMDRTFYNYFTSCGVHLTKMDVNWH